MTAPVLDRLIDITPGICGGQPRIAGRRITVADIAVWHEQMGLDADQIATEHGLTLPEIYTALAYFFDHREAFARSAEEDAAFVSALRAETPSPLRDKLAARRGG